jgi:hypothetical protein
MAYTKKLESHGDKASPCFRPFQIENLPHKYLPKQISLQVSVKHILINFMGTPNPMRILYNTSLLTES